jgi:hypothetical protein
LDSAMVSISNNEFTISESQPLNVGDQLTVKLKSTP